jgi:hypothetical protein
MSVITPPELLDVLHKIRAKMLEVVNAKQFETTPEIYAKVIRSFEVLPDKPRLFDQIAPQFGKYMPTFGINIIEGAPPKTSTEFLNDYGIGFVLGFFLSLPGSLPAPDAECRPFCVECMGVVANNFKGCL